MLLLRRSAGVTGVFSGVFLWAKAHGVDYTDLECFEKSKPLLISYSLPYPQNPNSKANPAKYSSASCTASPTAHLNSPVQVRVVRPQKTAHNAATQVCPTYPQQLWITAPNLNKITQKYLRPSLCPNNEQQILRFSQPIRCWFRNELAKYINQSLHT